MSFNNDQMSGEIEMHHRANMIPFLKSDILYLHFPGLELF